MSTASTSPKIVDNPAKHRFETTIEGHLAKIDYKLEGKTMNLEQTSVPEELQGRGLAGQLVQACLTSARERGLSVTPSCEVAFGYMKKRPETQDLLSEEGKRKMH